MLEKMPKELSEYRISDWVYFPFWSFCLIVINQLYIVDYYWKTELLKETYANWILNLSEILIFIHTTPEIKIQIAWA